VTTASFDGHAPMHLEAAAAPDAAPIDLPLTRDAAGIWRTDWAPLLPALSDTRRGIADRAGLFHATLAATLLAQASTLRAGTGIARIGLTGGVFQNHKLTETVLRLARASGFTVFLPERLPCNDAGLSFGQVIEANACP